MEIDVSTEQAGEIDVQALAIPFFKSETADGEFTNQLDEATKNLIRSTVEAEELTGKEGEMVYLYLGANGGEGHEARPQRLLLIGAGEREEYKAANASNLAGAAARFLRGKNVKSIGFMPRGGGSNGDASDTEASSFISASVEGVMLGMFDTDKYRTSDREERSIERLVIIDAGDGDALREAAQRGRVVGEAVNFARDLANEPGLYMTPTVMAERAQGIASEYNLEIDVLDHERMEAEGMGALLGVARGSSEPAKLIVLKYTPEGYEAKEGEPLLALVGKGLTFDSGGISLKPGENMEQMKYDMCGGAAVLGAMRAIAQLKPSMPVLGVVPSSENMPDARAIKPGDIVRAMNGKTIEVINTDAEGRLILADAMGYAKKLGATHIIDLATLTGAVVVALGDVNVAVLGTDQTLINDIIAAGTEVGEKYWQLPLDKEYSKQIKSDIADLKNIGGRKGGTITAAAFLKEFAEDTSWAHLDIAGTAWSDDAKPHRAKGPTGIAVRMLVNLVERYARDGMK